MRRNPKGKRKPPNNPTLRERMAVLETKVEDLRDHVCAKIDPIKKAVDRHDGDFKEIYKELLRLNRNLAFFKGKVIGFALGGSALVSIATTLIVMFWPK